MLVRRGSIRVGVVEVLSLDARPFSRKETCLLEGLVLYNVLPTRALTLDVSRGVLIRRSDPLPASCHVLACLVGKAAKRMTGRVPVPYHASRDLRVR
jgi:hypothetical protein